MPRLGTRKRRSSGVDLVELAFGPRDRILRGHALDRLGIHVDDEVLGQDLGGLLAGGSGKAGA
jgi:hypothetical protein